jgi:hypothetical protein
MSRTVTLSAALVFAAVMALAAQGYQSSEDKSQSMKKVTLTGCLQSGSSANSYMLTGVSGDLDMSKDKDMSGQQGTSGMSGERSSVTLMAASKSVDLKDHVGHKVEVSGMWNKSGTHMKSKSGMVGTSGQSGMSGETSTDMSMPRMKVTIVKHLADTCSSQ